MNRQYIGARYIPIPYNNPNGGYGWLPGVAYEGMTIVTYNNRSYISKRNVPAISTPPDEDPEHWVPAYLYNADVSEALLQIEELQEEKADNDGVYPNLWAGQLISDEMRTDNQPYLMRETADGLNRIGGICYPVLIGASVAENQLVKNGDFSDGTTGWSGNATYSASDNVLSVTQNESSQYVSQNWNKIANHKYFYTADVKATDGRISFNGVLPTITATGAWQTNQTITNASASGSEYLVVRNGDATYPSTWQMRSIMRIDLTLLLGSSIADYVYSLEQTTAGSGIAWLRSYDLITDEYKPYNTGTIESVEATAHKMVGFNQWDEEWKSGYYDTTGGFIPNASYVACKNKIPVLPNTQYCISSQSKYIGRICFYDADENFISTITGIQSVTTYVFATSSNAHYMTFDMVSGYGPTYKNDICINLSSDRNGEYEPYQTKSYPLGSDTLRGIFKLDTNNNLYADGDRKEADGTITRYYGEREYQEGDESLTDAITDGTATVYKLTTPVTEQSTPFTSPQIVYPDGTEEYVTSNGVPVGHETEYPYDLKGLVEGLIDVPDVPDVPGTYTLKATKTAAGLSYSWVAD